jgi:hypothetical protein
MPKIKDSSVLSKSPIGEDQHAKGNTVQDTEAKQTEQGGPKGLEPTRYGDWEQKGRCIDF